MTEVYLDHAAATPLRPGVRDAMSEAETYARANPSAVHGPGRRAGRALEDARERIGGLLGLPSGSIYFVRGGTEANNLAILGRADRLRAAGTDPCMIRTPVEHSSVARAMAEATRGTGSQHLVSVTPSGGLGGGPDLEELLERRPHLASVQGVNHETGTVLPLAQVMEACRRRRVPVHSDLVQALGRIPLETPDGFPELASFSAHKVGGPRSMAALVVRDRELLSPRLFGGGQEDGLRPGTEDVVGAVGFAAALELALDELHGEAARLADLRDALEAGLLSEIPDLEVHGGEGPRAPHILNVGVRDLAPDVLPRALDLEGISASAGSACRSGSTNKSPVLAGFYGDERAARTAPLRFSLGWTTRPADIDRALKVIPEVVARVRHAMASQRP